MGAPVVHFEIIGKDADTLFNFYSQLFGWKINADNPMKYGLVDAQGKGIGGGVAADPEGQHSHVTIYAEVDDPQAYLDKAEQLGGKTVVPVTEIPGMVTFAMFTDPEGHLIGVVKSEEEG
ncbi:MAG: VOC family protein [Calditrichaeota bacterium]|nr:MAG: VOC family protein [Calditrichota bacterium]